MTRPVKGQLFRCYYRGHIVDPAVLGLWLELPVVTEVSGERHFDFGPHTGKFLCGACNLDLAGGRKFTSDPDSPDRQDRFRLGARG
jgi:hypothetical protein